MNPNASEIQGYPTVPDIRDVDGPVDLAICAVPRAQAEQALIGCAETGVGSVIMFSAGFAEVDDGGRKAQSRLADIARDAKMRLAGPNCMGMANLKTGAIASFHPAFATPMSRDGRIGIVSQSGAFGGQVMMMAQRRQLPLAHVITTGNEADIQVSDGLIYLASQPHVDVILLYIEGVRDGARLIQGLELAHRNKKTVIAVKLGRTDVGESAAASHTAALAGSDAVFDAVLRQYGAHRAYSIEEFFELGCVAAIGGLPRNRDTGIVTVSGGVGVLMADDASIRGLTLPVLADETQAKIRDWVPFAGTRNPLDVTGQVINDLSLLNKSVDAIAQDPGDFGIVLMFMGAALANPKAAAQILPAWLDIRERHPDIWFALAGLMDADVQRQLDAAGIPTFAEPTHATRAAAALAGVAEAQARPLIRPKLTKGAQLPKGALNEVDSLKLLSKAGIATTQVFVAKTADDAEACAANIPGPVVVKILSADIAHKTDIGGVQIGLRSAQEVRDAFETCLENGRLYAPHARIQGCLVAPMAPDGVDVILGVTRDEVFGPVIMFGLGGVFVEVFEDVSFRIAPIAPDEADRMIQEVKGAQLLQGVRGAVPSDRVALAQAISDLSVFAAAHRDQIETFDTNPVRVLPKGQGVLGLDAVFIAMAQHANLNQTDIGDIQ